MMRAGKLTLSVLGGSIISGAALGQVPDLLTAFDAGGRAMGVGGSLYVTGADTLSSYYNPAGLAYLSQPMLGLTYRNFPESRTIASGDFANPDLDSEGLRGNAGVAHVGVAIPRAGGTIALSYTVGGVIDDVRTGTGLTSGALTVENYRETLEARSNFFTLAYARTNAGQNLSYGIGLQLVQQHIGNRQTGDLFSGTTQVGTLDVDNSETGTGIGIIAGVQYTPPSSPNVSFGLSYRSEINLSGNENTSSLYDKIPARLIAGVAMRRDGLRTGNDFAVFGAQIQHFFSGGDSSLFDRDPQTVLGFGLEYNYRMGAAFVPFRFGYNIVPPGGDGFGSRNAFTFGLGYRPDNARYTFNINFASPEGGGYDMGLALTYRFGS